MESVIVKVGDVFHKHHFSGNGAAAALKVGRGYACDIILNDPYVGSSQLELYDAGDGKQDWKISITDDTNPIFLNNKVVESTEFDICSGDEITIGRSTITIFKEEHDVAKTREFSFTNWLHHHKFKPVITSAMFLLLLGVTLLVTYLEVSTDVTWSILSISVIGVAILAIIWGTVWALVGHLLKGNHHFFSHLFFTSISFILFMITADIGSYFDYIFNSKITGEIVDWLIAIILSGVLIGFNLALVTYNPGAFKKGIIASVVIWGVFIALHYITIETYSNQPLHSVTIKPSYIPTRSPVTISTYVDDYDEIYKNLISDKND